MTSEWTWDDLRMTPFLHTHHHDHHGGGGASATVAERDRCPRHRRVTAAKRCLGGGAMMLLVGGHPRVTAARHRRATAVIRVGSRARVRVARDLLLVLFKLSQERRNVMSFTMSYRDARFRARCAVRRCGGGNVVATGGRRGGEGDARRRRRRARREDERRETRDERRAARARFRSTPSRDVTDFVRSSVAGTPLSSLLRGRPGPSSDL